jgi:hypothetical protein
MPPALAADFTNGVLAALTIIGDEIRERGYCDLSKREIARRAKVVRTIVCRAQRKALVMGLIGVQNATAAWPRAPHQRDPHNQASLA